MRQFLVTVTFVNIVFTFGFFAGRVSANWIPVLTFCVCSYATGLATMQLRKRYPR